MPANLYLKCPDCHMTFNSHSLLQKHRSKFCVGALTNPEMYSGRAQSEPEYTPRASEDRTNRQRQLRMAAESHGRNLAEYQSRSHQLERQKQEIDRRLQSFNNGDTYFMQQLRMQEDRNDRTLRELKKSVKGMKGGRPTSPNTLLAQIHAMRQAYLRQGGSNPIMLQQIAEMEQEAMRLGPREHKKHKSKGARYDSLMEQILSFELENNRLQKELLLIQERNNEHALLKRTAEEAAAREREMAARLAEYLQKLKDLEHEMELARQQAKMEQLRRDLENQRPARQPVEVAEMPAMMQIQAPQPPQMPMNMADADPLMMAPYDQHAGFMVFYDFISGLDMGVSACRLVVGLYNNTALYGEPSVLPTVYTESGGAGHYQQGSNQATIGAKQPVPRCPPQQDLGLVMELQTAAGGMPPQQYPGAQAMPPMHPHANRLVTSAWTKIDLFDPQGRLISGRWKVPLRQPPMRPNIQTAELYSNPQYGQAEIYFRLVNLRDAHVQAMGTIGPQSLHMYQHPPQAHAFQAPPSSYPLPPPSTSPPATADSYRR